MSKQKQTAASSDSTALAIDNEAMRELGGLEIEEDGLHEISQRDIKLATKTLNMKGVDKFGEEVPKSSWYDTIDETVKKTLLMIPVSLHKTNVYSKFNTTDNKTYVICRSDDQKTGTMRETREQRPCAGCPDARWYDGVDDQGGKRTMRNCNEVQNVVAYDSEEKKLFSIRFKKGAGKLWTDHMNRHYLNKGKAAGFARQHIPIFAFELKLTGALAEGGTHAVPVIERGRILSRGEYLEMAEGAKVARELAAARAAAADEQGEGSEQPEGGDTSFNTDGFTKGKGQDFAA